MHSCEKTAINGCSWPNFWANLTKGKTLSHFLAVVPLDEGPACGAGGDVILPRPTLAYTAA